MKDASAGAGRGRTGKGCVGGTRLLSPLPASCSLPGCSEWPLQLRTSRSAGKALLATGWGLSLLPKALGAQRPAPVGTALTQVTPTSTPQAPRPVATGSPESIGACWGRAMGLSALTGDPRLPGPCAQHCDILAGCNPGAVALCRGAPRASPTPRQPPSSHCGAGGWLKWERGSSLGLQRETQQTARLLQAGLWPPPMVASSLGRAAGLRGGPRHNPLPGTPWDSRHSQAGTNLITSCAFALTRLRYFNINALPN